MVRPGVRPTNVRGIKIEVHSLDLVSQVGRVLLVETPEPTKADKYSPDLGVKLTYLAEKMDEHTSQLSQIHVDVLQVRDVVTQNLGVIKDTVLQVRDTVTTQLANVVGQLIDLKDVVTTNIGVIKSTVLEVRDTLTTQLSQIHGVETEIRDYVSQMNAKVATEATLADVRDRVTAIYGVVSRLQFDSNNFLRVNIANADIAVPVDIQYEAIGLATFMDTVSTQLQLIKAVEENIRDVVTTQLAQHTTLLTEVRDKLSSIDSKVATDATLQSVRDYVSSINARVATEATLAQVRDNVSAIRGKTDQIYVDEYGRLRTGIVDYIKLFAQKNDLDTVTTGVKNYNGYVLSFPEPLPSTAIGSDETGNPAPYTPGGLVASAEFVSEIDPPMWINGLVRVAAAARIKSVSGNTVLTSCYIAIGIDDGTTLTWLAEKSFAPNVSVGAGGQTLTTIAAYFSVDRQNKLGDRLVLKVELYGYNDYASGSGEIYIIHTRGTDDTHVIVPVIR